MDKIENILKEKLKEIMFRREKLNREYNELLQRLLLKKDEIIKIQKEESQEIINLILNLNNEFLSQKKFETTVDLQEIFMISHEKLQESTSNYIKIENEKHIKEINNFLKELNIK